LPYRKGAAVRIALAPALGDRIGMHPSRATGERPSAVPAGLPAASRERIVDLAASAATRGERVAVFAPPEAPRGTMPPLHVRDRTETYEVLAGEVVFHVGRDAVLARAGDVVVAPEGVPRTFVVTSETARWLVTTAVRSLARYEDFTRALARPGRRQHGVAPTWPSAEEASAVAAIAAANGIAVLGPPGMLPPEL
jgi:mannose-6-phosphate isomerase-like protein (cupin superfamily)